MRILVLCYEYPPLGGGGGRSAKVISEELVRLGHEVRFQTARMPHLPTREIIGGVDIRRTLSFRQSEDRCSVLGMGTYVVTSFLPCLRHIAEWRPDVIHAHFAVPTGALAYAVSRITDVPYVLTVHLGDVPGGVPDQTDTLFRFLNPAIRPIWKCAAAITGVSSFVCKLAKDAYGQEVVRIPNGIAIPDHPHAPGKPGRTIRLLAVGRLNPQKNFPFLIEVLTELRDLDWHLDIAGDGDGRDALASAIRTNGLLDRVTLHGWRSNEEVATLMEASDLFLMPSLSEGLSVAAVEALEKGLAIVGSDIGGLHDLVDQDTNGVLLPVGDKSAFSKQLRALLSDPARIFTMKKASAGKVREFDLAAVGKAYERVLSDVAAS